MKVNTIIKNKYLVIKYLNIESDVTLKCLKCGNIFDINGHYASREKTKDLCPFCEITRKNCTEEQALFKLKNADENYKILEYRSLQDSTLEHICGHKIENGNISRIIKRNTKHCIACAHGSKAYDADYVRDEISRITNGEYEVLEDYKDESTPFLIKHLKCGHTWKVRRRNFVYKETRCPKCISALTRSKGAKFIRSYLHNNFESFNEESDTEIIFDGCRDKKPLPFDFYLRSINHIIEFDGELHFHKMRLPDSKKALKKLKITHKHDILKNEFCNNSDIKLLRIPYDISRNAIMTILKELITTKTLSSTTIETYNIYYGLSTSDNYYTRYDEDME